MRIQGNAIPRSYETGQRDLDARARMAIGLQKNTTRIHKALDYLEATHTYQLKRGNIPFGKPVKMIGRESVERNRDFDTKFFNDKTTGARLWHYFLIKETM